MPKLETNPANNIEASIYPRRVFEDAPDALDAIELLLADENSIVKLEDSERQELLDFETSLAEKLKDIYSISNPSCEFYLDYFSTPEGRELLKNHTGIQIDSSDPEEIEKITFE